MCISVTGLCQEKVYQCILWHIRKDICTTLILKKNHVLRFIDELKKK